LRKFFDIFLRAAATGIMIGIGGVVYLSCDNKYIGAALFGTGLFVILSFGFNLYTGKVGYAVEKESRYLGELGIIWLGNLCGTAAAGGLMLCTRAKGIGEKAAELCRVKMQDTLPSLFILAFFCGVLMFIAADYYKQKQKYLGAILAVPVFILAGFEHSIADMFYFCSAGAYNMEALIFIIIVAFGNLVGGVIIPVCRKYMYENPPAKA
jgi:formate/nitrite transporter FocA (FNT family)